MREVRFITLLLCSLINLEEVCMSNNTRLIVLTFMVAILVSAQFAWAQADGTWTAGGQTAVPVDNRWSNVGSAPDYATGNWAGGVMATGIDHTAYFNNIDVAAGMPRPIDMDTYETTGNMVFGDTNPATAGGWVINALGDPGACAIILSVTPGTSTPPAMSTVTVNDLGAGAAATINVSLYGSTATDGLIKAGVGTLTLSRSNFYTGGTVVNAGTLKLSGADDLLVTTAGGMTASRLQATDHTWIVDASGDWDTTTMTHL